MKKLISGGIAAATALAAFGLPRANADSNDVAFLRAFHAQGLASYKFGDVEAIESAHGMCETLDVDPSGRAVTTMVQQTINAFSDVWSQYQSREFIRDAIAFYCPQYIGVAAL